MLFYGVFPDAEQIPEYREISQRNSILNEAVPHSHQFRDLEEPCSHPHWSFRIRVTSSLLAMYFSWCATLKPSEKKVTSNTVKAMGSGVLLSPMTHVK